MLGLHAGTSDAPMTRLQFRPGPAETVSLDLGAQGAWLKFAAAGVSRELIDLLPGDPKEAKRGVDRGSPGLVQSSGRPPAEPEGRSCQVLPCLEAARAKATDKEEATKKATSERKS